MSTEPEARTVRVEAPVGPEHVYPVPKAVQAQKRYAPGPEMPGEVKPARGGRYLRYFDDVDDWAWSEFSDGQWLRDGFWPSDVQDAPWRGAVRPNNRLREDADDIKEKLGDTKEKLKKANLTIKKLKEEKEKQ